MRCLALFLKFLHFTFSTAENEYIITSDLIFAKSINVVVLFFLIFFYIIREKYKHGVEINLLHIFTYFFYCIYIYMLFLVMYLHSSVH